MSQKKKRYKTKAKKRGKQRTIQLNKKRIKDNKTLSQKSKKGAGVTSLYHLKGKKGVEHLNLPYCLKNYGANVKNFRCIVYYLSS
jgi:hypothetical protein